MDQNLQDGLSVLPENGDSITFDAWKTALNVAGKNPVIRHWLKWRRSGAIAFTVARDANDLPVLMVSRPTAEV